MTTVWAIAIAGGVVLGWALIVSPLTVAVLALAAVALAMARRGLPADEQRWLTTLLVAAVVARVLVILALLVASIRVHDDQTAGLLFGDELYTYGRSLRTRNILLGIEASKYDYQVIFDSYARTWYMTWLSWLQVTFGPSPYAIRLLNGVLFVSGAALLYRVSRRGFGVVPAIAGLATLLFLPSLFFWSISLLKESIYFLLTTLAVTGGVMLGRRGGWGAKAAGMLLLAVSLWWLADLRPGAVVLTGGGVLLGLAGRQVLRTRLGAAASAAAVAAVCAVVMLSPSLSARVLSALSGTAKQHTGHVFTVGHAYKTLDDKFYAKVDTPSTSQLTLTAAEAARYVARSAVSFVTVPLPWQIATKSELAFVPEQLLWYVLVVMAVVGLAPAWRRDAVLVAVLVGYVVPLAAVLALTNGNVGTLVRLRGLVLPFVVWIGAFGCVFALERLMRRGEAVA